MSESAKQHDIYAKGAQIGVSGDHAKVEGGIHFHENVHNYASPTPSSVEDDALPCPYKGLFHFGPDDADVFFGREEITKKLIQLTEERTAITVLGASGSGKSSVVLAGRVLVDCG